MNLGRVVGRCWLGMLVLAAQQVAADGSPAEPKLAKAELHSWLLPSCPGTPKSAEFAFGLEALAVMAVDFVFDEIGQALAKAAEEDKNGSFSRGADPSYLYTHIPAYSVVAEGETVAKEAASTKMIGCLVLAKSTTPPSAWCSTDSPFRADTRLCEPAAQKLLAGALDIDVGDGESFSVQFGVPVSAEWAAAEGLPEIYAEIALHPASDQAGLLPELQTLFYPRGIHGGKFAGDRARQLILSASGSLPSGDAALSSIVLSIPELRPRPGVVLSRHPKSGAASTLPKSPGALWVAAIAPKEKTLLPSAGGGVLALNVRSEVREIGAENPFLQVLAKWLTANKATLAGAVKTQVIPSLSDAAHAAAAQGQGDARAKYDEAVAASFKAVSLLSEGCRADASTAEERRTKLAKVSESFFSARMAQQKLLLLAESLRIEDAERVTPKPVLVGKAFPSGDAETACLGIFTE